MFDAVLAADRAWGIGKDNGLPWPRLKGDLAHFRKITTGDGGNAVVMGRNTWQSKEVLGKPLPRRRNVVVTRGELAVPDEVVVAHSLDEAIAVPAARVFVVGGAHLYREAFVHPQLQYIYLTRVDGEFGCDATIDDLDVGFVRDAELLRGEDNGVRYAIERLIRRPGT